MYQLAMYHYPNEYGGLLVGRYSASMNMVTVNNLILPREYSSSRFHFNRGVKGIKKILEYYYKKTPPLFYVGEWHTHPDSAPVPSPTDFNAMRDIVASPQVQIENPILLIMNITKQTYDLRSYLFFKDKLYEYQLN